MTTIIPEQQSEDGNFTTVDINQRSQEFSTQMTSDSEKTSSASENTIGKKRRLKWSIYDLAILNEFYHKNPYPSKNEYIYLTKKFQVKHKQVKSWFHNRRIKDKQNIYGKNRLNQFKKPQSWYVKTFHVKYRSATKTTPQHIINALKRTTQAVQNQRELNFH